MKKNVIFNSLPAMVEAIRAEMQTVRGWSFMGIENYHSKGTGELANYLINISPALGSTMKKKELTFWEKYAENPFHNAIAVITAKAEGREFTQSEVDELAELQPKAEAQWQTLTALIKAELISGNDTEYWNASADAIADAVFALNHARKNPNPRRRNGALNSFTEIGDTGLRWFDNTENYAIYGLKVNKRSILPATNPKKQGARELTRGKDFIRAKYLKGRRQFILDYGMAVVVNGKRFMLVEAESSMSTEPTMATNELVILQQSAENRIIAGERAENIFSI